jgi:hypothetical protein
MTRTRAAAYVGSSALLVAWFAAAAGAPVFQEVVPPRDAAGTVSTSGSRTLAVEVQAQALKLRARLAEAPAPDLHTRNPFSFAPERIVRTPAPAVKAAAADPLPVVDPVVPALSLMGIAEEMSPEGLHRTAVLGGANGAVYMVMEGQDVAERYRVTAIGKDAIELKDLITGAYRRLAMR